MAKEPLSRRRPIRALEVKIMEEGQNFQGLVGSTSLST